MKKDYVSEMPAELSDLLNLSATELNKEIKMLTAVKLYELGKISASTGAEIAELDRVSFLLQLSNYKVSIFNYAIDEIESEFS